MPALAEPELAGADSVPFRDVWCRGLPVAPGEGWISGRHHLRLVPAATGLATSVSAGYHPVGAG